jgi:hypothetical protein
MKHAVIPILLLLPGCALTPNVDTRHAGRDWNYYGNLSDVYRDETRGRPVALVWLNQVQFVQTSQRDFSKTVKSYTDKGFRRIGFLSVQSARFVDPYEVEKLAADKGAKLVLGAWARTRRGRSRNMTEYWYQLLDK